MDTEARITARIIVHLDAMTAHEEAGGIVESAHPMTIAEEVIGDQGALNTVGAVVLEALNTVGAVVLEALPMHVIETIAVNAPGVEVIVMLMAVDTDASIKL